MWLIKLIKGLFSKHELSRSTRKFFNGQVYGPCPEEERRNNHNRTVIIYIKDNMELFTLDPDKVWLR